MIDNKDDKTKFGVDLQDYKPKGEEDKPLSFGDWLKLNLTPEKKKEVVENILKQIQSIVDDRNLWQEKVEMYRNAYGGEMEETSIPFSGCFHKDTEIFTKDGWKLVKDVKVDEEVITRKPITGELEFRPVIATQNYKNVGKLVQFKHRSFEILVTPDHKMYLEDPIKKTYRFVEAKDFPRSGHIPQFGIWNSEPAIEFFGYKADVFLEFLGWFISEGFCYKHATICIAQGQVHKENRDKIKNCLDKMGVVYKEKENLFMVSLPQGLTAHLYSLGRSWEKHIPRIYLDLPPKQLKILFDALVDGDGHRAKRKEGRRDEIDYYTSSKLLADDVQEIILKLGYSANISVRDRIGKRCCQKVRPFNPGITRHLSYCLSVRYTKFLDLKRTTKQYVDYNDDVYCVTVPPYHTIYVRYKGKPLWIGQCFNLNVPIITKYQDACVSQTEEAFEDVDPKWTVEMPYNRKLEPYIKDQTTILDYYSDTEMEDTDVWTKIYHDAFLLPCGWGGMVYKREVERIRTRKTYRNIQEFQRDFPDDFEKYPNYIKKLEAGKVVEIIAEYNQEMSRSPRPEHYEWEDIVVPLETDGLEGMKKARLVARRIMKRWEDIATLEQEGDYNKGVSNELQWSPELDKDGAKQFDADYMKKEYTTWEVTYFVDIDDDGQEERCMFNIEEDRKVCLRDIRYPYDHYRSYIIPFYIQKTRTGIYQPAMGEKLMHVNIAANATLNNTLNASTIANSLSLKVRSGTDAVRALYEHKWYPGSILELSHLDDVDQFQFGTPNLAGLINLFAIIERFGEDVSGIVNYQVGKESPDDPTAPASKAFALMRKAEIKLRRYIKCLKRSNNEMGYQALRLIYQFTPKQRLAEILGTTVDKVSDYKTLPIKCKTQATGFSLEKMFAKRDNMQMIGMLLKDPMVAGDPLKRAQVYEIVAEEHGSNWDKKLRKVISVEEVKEKQKAAQDAEQEKEMEIGRNAAKQVLEQGGDEKAAKDAGDQAIKLFRTMKQREKALEAQPPKKGGQR